MESAAYVTDEVEARLLADIFSPRRGSIPTRAPTRSSKPAATKLLANLLPAAAVANRPITLVYLWLTDPTEDEAVEILRSDGYDLVAVGLREVVNAPEKQCGGVYGTVKQIAAFLTKPCSGSFPAAPAAASLIRTRLRAAPNTLYSISREGIGSDAPLVSNLTVAVMEAAKPSRSLASRPADDPDRRRARRVRQCLSPKPACFPAAGGP